MYNITRIRKTKVDKYIYAINLSPRDVKRLMAIDLFQPLGLSGILLRAIELGIDVLEKDCVRSGD